VKSFILALQLLTIVTLKPTLAPSPELVAASRRWFALVGAGVGAVVALVAVISGALLPPLAAGVLSVGAWEGLSRFLHLDGLMDSADGLIPPVEPSRAVEIMRDVHVGAFGVGAAILVMGFKFAAMAALISASRAWALVGVAAAARGAAAVLAGLLGPSPDRQGLGAAVAGPAKGAAAINIVVAALALAPAGMQGLAAGVLALVSTVILGAFFRFRLGGITGDCLGATIELVEAAALGALAAGA